MRDLSRVLHFAITRDHSLMSRYMLRQIFKQLKPLIGYSPVDLVQRLTRATSLGLCATATSMCRPICLQLLLSLCVADPGYHAKWWLADSLRVVSLLLQTTGCDPRFSFVLDPESPQPRKSAAPHFQRLVQAVFCVFGNAWARDWPSHGAARL